MTQVDITHDAKMLFKVTSPSSRLGYCKVYHCAPPLIESPPLSVTPVQTHSVHSVDSANDVGLITQLHSVTFNLC